jgi:hypothetical protein
VVPPVLYLPCRPTIPGSQPEIELRRLEDGRLALLGYTALDRLARCCGPRQAWVLYQTAELSALRAQTSYDVVLLDQELPRELWASEDDA